ncbi:hypothetical protein HFP72_04870 [Nocardiopsis sp. ARC36]
MLSDAELETGRVRLLADLVVGAALANAGKGERGMRDGSMAAADLARRLDTAEAEARIRAKEWLNTDRPEDAFERNPLHWPLAFPEAFENGGFDAVIGNPPFLGGKKISGSTGPAYREYLVENTAKGVKGNADLVSYFALTCHAIANGNGQVGIIATNTLAQSDTREVGLDQLEQSGIFIRKAISSKPWPARSASLQFCAIWTSKEALHPESRKILNGEIVHKISPLSASRRDLREQPRIWTRTKILAL